METVRTLLQLYSNDNAFGATANDAACSLAQLMTLQLGNATVQRYLYRDTRLLNLLQLLAQQSDDLDVDTLFTLAQHVEELYTQDSRLSRADTTGPTTQFEIKDSLESDAMKASALQFLECERSLLASIGTSLLSDSSRIPASQYPVSGHVVLLGMGRGRLEARFAE